MACMLRKSKRSSQMPGISYPVLPAVRVDILRAISFAQLMRLFQSWEHNGFAIACDPFPPKSLSDNKISFEISNICLPLKRVRRGNAPFHQTWSFHSPSSYRRHGKRHCFLLPRNKGIVSTLYSGQSSATITVRVMTWSHLIQPRLRCPMDLQRSSRDGVNWWLNAAIFFFFPKKRHNGRHHVFFSTFFHLAFFLCSHLGRSHGSVLLPL